MKNAPSALCALLLALCAGLAHAQAAARAAQPSAGPAVGSAADALTLEQAIDLALQQAPQVQAQAAALDAAQAESIAAGRLPDPELVLGIDNLPAGGADAWSFDRDPMTMRKAGVMQTFPNASKRASQRARAAAAISVARSRLREVQLATARQAALAWIELRTSRQVVAKLHEMRPMLAARADALRAALAGGRESSAAALGAEIRVGEIEDRLLDAGGQAEAAGAELARWIGEPPPAALAAPPAFGDLPIERARLLNSLHRHAVLRSFEARRSLAQSEIDLARAEKRPDWSAQLAYGQRGAGLPDMVSLEFRVGLPLFGAARQDPRIRARRAELLELEAEREAQLREHAAELTGMFAAWQTATRRIELYERERLPLARERAQALLAGYESGRVDLAEVYAGRIEEIQTQIDYALLLAEQGRAWAYLRYLEVEGDSP